MRLGLLDLALKRIETICQFFDISSDPDQLAVPSAFLKRIRTLCWDLASWAAY